MTDQERNQVLKMIQDGKISAEEGLRLMQALDESPAEDAQATAVPGTAAQPPVPPVPSTPPQGEMEWKMDPSNMEEDPRIKKIKTTVQRLWQIPLWIGILITVASAVGMYLILQGGLNFWFFFLILPLLLGVAIIALAVGSHKARWIFVDVRQKPGEKPERIFLGFPLPLKFAAWFIRTFQGWIPGLRQGLHGANFDELVEIFETGMGKDGSVIAHVDEGEGGERVRVYIG